MKIRPGFLKRVLGGAVFGLYTGHLVLFLNPQIEISSATLLPVVLGYALLCGVLMGTGLWLLRVARVRLFGRPEGEYRPHGFGYVVVASFLATAIYWGHLVFFRIYLPVGATRVLSKATILLGAVSIVLLALWFLERNAARTTSAWILAVATTLVIASSFTLSYRRDRYREVAVHGHPVAIEMHAQHRVTVVAVKSLSHDWIVTANAEGNLSFFRSAIASGRMTRMLPFNSSSSRALWASLATGKLPHRHGVTGRYSYRTLLNRREPWLNIPVGIGFHNWGLLPPVEKIAAPLPAGSSLPVWAIFERTGSGAAVVNWPVSHGRLGGIAFAVSDRICADPLAASEPMRGIVGAACDEAARLGPQLGQRHAVLGKRDSARIREAAVADDAAIRAAIAMRRDNGPPLTVIALNQIDETARAIGQTDNSLPRAGTARGDALRAAIERIDALLAAIDEGIDGDVVFVVSPSGFDPPPIPVGPITALQQLLPIGGSRGADEGFLLTSGAGGRIESYSEDVHVADLAPTVLFAAGLPIARDIDGRVLTEALGEPVLSGRSAQYIQTYEKTSDR